MSDQTNFIDLTVDSPRITRSRLRDSIVEISIDTTCHGEEATDIIDVESNNETVKTNIYCIDESNNGNLVALACSICYQQFSSRLKVMTTRCGHIFCAPCLKLALREAKRCPTCKRASKFQTCIRLYF